MSTISPGAPNGINTTFSSGLAMLMPSAPASMISTSSINCGCLFFFMAQKYKKKFRVESLELRVVKKFIKLIKIFIYLQKLKQ